MLELFIKHNPFFLKSGVIAILPQPQKINVWASRIALFCILDHCVNSSHVQISIILLKLIFQIRLLNIFCCIFYLDYEHMIRFAVKVWSNTPITWLAPMWVWVVRRNITWRHTMFCYDSPVQPPIAAPNTNETFYLA